MNNECPITELDDFILNFLESNPKKIKQVLENLIMNIVKIYLSTRLEPSMEEFTSLLEDCYGYYEEILNLHGKLK